MIANTGRRRRTPNVAGIRMDVLSPKLAQLTSQRRGKIGMAGAIETETGTGRGMTRRIGLTAHLKGIATGIDAQSGAMIGPRQLQGMETRPWRLSSRLCLHEVLTWR